MPTQQRGGEPLRSFTDRTYIQNNTPSDIGPAQLAVRWLEGDSPIRAEIIVMPLWAEESFHYEVPLGETFPVGEETWRFADLDMKNADEWHVIVRRVDENEVMTPPSGRAWKSARLRPYGQLDEAQLQAVEAELGTRLPASYRRWLADTNGAQPEMEHHIPGRPFLFIPERPLFGVHPQHPSLDLVQAQREHRDPWLSPDWLVIANLAGGLLVLSLRMRDMEREGIYFLPDTGLSGPIGPEGAAGRERHLVPVTRSMGDLLGRITPVDVSDLPPAEIVWPGQPGHSAQEAQSPWALRPEDYPPPVTLRPEKHPPSVNRPQEHPLLAVLPDSRPPAAETPPGPAQVVPVGEFFGTFYPTVGSPERIHRVRLGAEVWELDNERFILWALAHGAGAQPAEQPRTVSAVRDAAARQLPGVDTGPLLDALIAERLLVEVAPAEAVEFARRHRVGARLLGLGNSAEEPWLWSIGFFEHPMVKVTRTVYNLWERAPSGESLWAICQALAAEEREANATDPDLFDPERMLTAFLQEIHQLLVASVIYLEPLP